MSTLRLRVELNKGRVGMPIGKLARVCDETTQFLTMLGEDIGLPANGDLWLAEAFENASVDFDLRCAAPLSDDIAELGRRALRMMFSGSLEDGALAMLVRPETRRQFHRITSPLDVDEIIRFGIYRDAEAQPEAWFDIGKFDDLEFSEGLIDRNAYGEVQGVVNAFFKEHKPPYLRIRELSTGELVKCYFQPEMYQTAVELLEDREAVVFVEGRLKEDAATGKTREIAVEDFRPAPEFDLALFERMLGTIPDYTGDLTSEQFVEQARGNR